MTAADRAQAEIDLNLTESGVWLTFVRIGPTKWYARTPLGEYAYGEHQGLYEWARDDTGQPIRIDHTGGDAQCSSDGKLWTFRGRRLDPTLRGLHAARSPHRLN